MRGERCPTCHRRMTRTVDQNRRYWALMHRLAERLRPRGQEFSAETYHLWAKSKWLGCIDYVLPSGRTLTIPNSTAALDTQQFSDYLTQVESWANEHDIYLEDMET